MKFIRDESKLLLSSSFPFLPPPVSPPPPRSRQKSLPRTCGNVIWPRSCVRECARACWPSSAPGPFRAYCAKAKIPALQLKAPTRNLPYCVNTTCAHSSIDFRPLVTIKPQLVLFFTRVKSSYVTATAHMRQASHFLLLF